MKILFVNVKGPIAVKDMAEMPQLGQKVKELNKPWPIVQDVMLWPDSTTLTDLGRYQGRGIVAIVTVK